MAPAEQLSAQQQSHLLHARRRVEPEDLRTHQVYASQLAIERQLAEIRTTNHLATQDIDQVRGRGAIAEWVNAIFTTPSFVLPVRTSLETGTILPDGSVTMLEWETDRDWRHHWRGVMPIVVGKPTERVPEATAECLSARPMEPEDLYYIDFIKPLHLEPLSATKLRDLARQKASPATKERLVEELIVDEALLGRALHSMAKKGAPRNVDKRASGRDDVASIIHLELLQALERFTTPERDELLNVGRFTSYLFLNAPRRVERDTAQQAGVSTRHAALSVKLAAVSADTYTESAEVIAQQIAEANPSGTVPPVSTIAEHIRRERVAEPMSLQHRLGDDESGEVEAGDLHGEVDPGFERANEEHINEYQLVAAKMLIGSGVPQTTNVINAVARWLELVATPTQAEKASRARPTRPQLEDPDLGWPTATWVLTPLLRKGESWLQAGTLNTVLGRLHKLLYRNAGQTTRSRNADEVRKMWVHYLEHEDHQRRAEEPPPGVST